MSFKCPHCDSLNVELVNKEKFDEVITEEEDENFTRVKRKIVYLLKCNICQNGWDEYDEVFI